LVRELKEQGLSNKVIADMFGMALRTYHTRVAQLAESHSEQGRSLWEAVFGCVQREQPVLRATVLERFAGDDSTMVRAVLRDLVDSGLVYRSGRGDATCYRARDTSDQAAELPGGARAIESMLLVAIHRHPSIARAELLEHVPLADPTALDAALHALVAHGSVQARGEGEAARFSCERCVIPFGDAHGWEAAVLDHYQAMVSALVNKLRVGERRAARADRTGGSTFVFDLHEGHPLQEEVLGSTNTLGVTEVRLRRER
jgi:hypothetical protein